MGRAAHAERSLPLGLAAAGGPATAGGGKFCSRRTEPEPEPEPPAAGCAALPGSGARPPAMGLGLSLSLLAPALWALLLLSASEETVPRVSLHYGSSERPVWWFEKDGVTNYTTLLLSPDGATLYVGAREFLFALNTSHFQPGPQHQLLPWSADKERKKQCAFKGKDPQRDCHNYIKILLQLNSTHLYACGTGAFSPVCTYLNVQNFSQARELLEDGKGRCPFDPEYKSTAIMVDGELYAGTVSDFQGKEPTIYRSQESRISLKTENSLHWLHDPAFVGSAYLRESLPPGNSEGDDDKVYFFFSETGKEFDFFENTIVSRIARVCKGDLGGERVLQRRWTTFLKAQLLCSRPDDGFPFNVLQDMFVLTPDEQRWRDTVFYGVFTSQWNKGGPGSSAVCAFAMRDVQKAFGGLYKEVNRETQQWYTDTSHPPEPRPGAMPDRVLNFIKDHFLMDGAIRSQPLLLQGRVHYQQICVQRVRGLHHTYDVLFLGTDDGRLHKAVSVNQKVHIIEEIRLFHAGHPVHKLLLDQSQGLLYAASYSAVAQVPVSNCSLYRSCGECVLSRDPYCAWSGDACRSVAQYHLQLSLHPRPWAQDIEDADTERLCQAANVSLPIPPLLRSPAEGPQCQQIRLLPNAVRPLPCRLLSNLASRLWVHNGTQINSSYLVLPDGALILVGSLERLGTYECWSLEEGFQKLMASYCVGVEELSPALHGPPDAAGRRLPGQDAMETISTSRSTSAVGGVSSRQDGRSYWPEFLVMCALFGATLLLLALLVLCRHRDSMKAFLKPGECPSGGHRKVGLPVESLPLNGSSLPSTAPDHKGYQALTDSYISTPPHVPPGASSAFSHSEKRPLSVRESFVEVSPACQRPRVRLGSEIRDSVV
ncbi:semaphorin-4B isoform X2 [Lepidochelys kempii]|uniref:semaphorin-4B isoform X2 n=1 Tax=Lepidochelys kempii TaxID=8472 RepID=UPI003C6F39BB